MKRIWLAISVAIATSTAATASHAQSGTAPAHSEWRTPWSYAGAANGAQHWGDLDPLYEACKTGKEQSPIDIRGARKSALAPLRFSYTSGALAHFVNNGYTVRVNYPAGNGNVLLVGDTTYELTQFHFHRPSEEYVDGKPYEMVIHLMHKSSDGRIVGVAVLVVQGRANAVVEQLWAHMPQNAGDEKTVTSVEINPANLLPRDLAYYAYQGSLTAPPCSEGVTWYVLKTPVTLSPEQIKAFAALYPHDVRPLQPLNGRVVHESE